MTRRWLVAAILTVATFEVHATEVATQAVRGGCLQALILDSVRQSEGGSRLETKTTETWRLRTVDDAVLWSASRTWRPVLESIGPVTGRILCSGEDTVVALTWLAAHEAKGVTACADLYLFRASGTPEQWRATPAVEFRKFTGAVNAPKFVEVAASESSVTTWVELGRKLHVYRYDLATKAWSEGVTERLTRLSPIEDVRGGDTSSPPP